MCGVLAGMWYFGQGSNALLGRAPGGAMLWYLRRRARHAFFFFQAEDGIRDVAVTGVQTCALPILPMLRQGAVSGTTTTGAQAPNTVRETSPQPVGASGLSCGRSTTTMSHQREAWLKASTVSPCDTHHSPSTPAACSCASQAGSLASASR